MRTTLRLRSLCLPDTIANPPSGIQPTTPFHRGQYFDLYTGNITTRYADVFWRMMPHVPLPPAFVSEYAGKTVALTGYEVDAVRQLPDGSEQSVPLTDAYNHHHNAYIYSSKATLVNVGAGASLSAQTHGGMRDAWEIRRRPRGPRARLAAANESLHVPLVAFLVDGNGGEYRKSLHATAEGYAMLVDSPATLAVQPMMINTNDRARGRAAGSWDLFPAEAYGGGRNATPPERPMYSGLLECPCTDRKTRSLCMIDHQEESTHERDGVLL